MTWVKKPRRETRIVVQEDQQTVKGIPDGQLFWIIRNGSPGTSMPGFKTLREDQIWQLVTYLRVLAK